MKSDSNTRIILQAVENNQLEKRVTALELSRFNQICKRLGIPEDEQSRIEFVIARIVASVQRAAQKGE